MVWIAPVAVGMGLADPFETLDNIREWERIRGRWVQWEKEQLFVGADSDHPDGIYAKSGNDFVCMTNEEYVHWYGRRCHSSRNEAGEREGPCS